MPALEFTKSRLFQSLNDNRGDVVAFLVLVGFSAVLRFWNLAQLGLTHFDEGSYTMAGKWLASWGQEGWFIEAGHSPPLFPSLVGLYFLLFGVSDSAAISVSATMGSLTIGLIYLIGKQWFGRRTAVPAALFLATCEYHVIYSRLALTDTTFTFLFWSALAAFFHSVQKADRRWMLLGGVLTGLCWNTKYHGFFPLIIVGVWLLSSSLRTVGLRPVSLLKGLNQKHFPLAAGLALLMYIPWAVLVQFTVGYWSIFLGQLDHSFGQLQLVLTTPSAIYFYLSRWLSPPILGLAVLGLSAVLVERNRPALFLLNTTLLFSASTLFYMSFPRLVLPIVPAICLLSGYGVQVLSQRMRSFGPVIVQVITAVVMIWSLFSVVPVLSLPTDAYREAAAYLQNFNSPLVTQMSKNYYFYEKRKSFEMRRHGLDELDSLIAGASTAIVAVDPIVHRLPEVRVWLEKHRADLTLLRSLEVGMYEPVYYQGFDPTQGLLDLPRSVAPAVPGANRIEVYRHQK